MMSFKVLFVFLTYSERFRGLFSKLILKNFTCKVLSVSYQIYVEQLKVMSQPFFYGRFFLK